MLATYYFWTHSAYFYPGNKCRNKAPEHQDSAILTNRLGGSIWNARGVPQTSSQPNHAPIWQYGTVTNDNLSKLNTYLKIFEKKSIKAFIPLKIYMLLWCNQTHRNITKPIFWQTDKQIQKIFSNELESQVYFQKKNPNPYKLHPPINL